MSDVQYIEIGPDGEGQRLDNFLLKTLKGVPKSAIYRIIRKGEVRVNKKRAAPLQKLCLGDMVRVPPVRTAAQAVLPKMSATGQARIEAAIIYEDDALLVLNKPRGLAVHGGSGIQLGVIESLRLIRPSQRFLELVHRLDRDTSGCLLIAKKRSMLTALHRLLEEKRVEKIYHCILQGTWQGKTDLLIDAPLLKNTLQSGERMVRVHSDGKPSQTHYRLLENFAHACLVEARPKTGRTHQIRVHAKHMDKPLLGDDKYGRLQSTHPLHAFAKRLFLHAACIRFKLDGKSYVFEAPLDDLFQQTLLELAL